MRCRGAIARVSPKRHSLLCRNVDASYKPILLHHKPQDWQAIESRSSSVVQELLYGDVTI